MIKPALAIVLGVLAVGVGTFSTAQQPNTNPPATWTVVGVTGLNNRSGNLVENLFVPQTTGIYRATLYAETSGTSYSSFSILYSNGFGTPFQGLYGGDNLTDTSIVGTFQARGGTPVTLQVGTSVSDPTLVWSCTVTIEHLVTTP